LAQFLPLPILFPSLLTQVIIFVGGIKGRAINSSALALLATDNVTRKMAAY
jgi:hypothetical protein